MSAISTNITECDPTVLRSTIRPSRLASASVSTGVPRSPAVQACCSKRRPSQPGHAGEVLRKLLLIAGQHIDADLPVPANTACAALDWFTQTSMVGGLSVTEQTALAVMPSGHAAHRS